MADLEADRLRALMRATVFGQPRQPVTIDRYEIVRLLGSGAMGLVYEVFDPKRGEQVALKTLRGHSPRALSLFKREFRALSRITHPNLVALYELGRDEHQFFFTMELVRGSPLLKYLWGSDPPDVLPDADDTAAAGARAALPPTPVADFHRLRGVFHQLSEGVHTLHQAHKLHRDIKPTNVMVNPHGRVVLMDFGFVGEQSVGSNFDSTAGSLVVGTPAYMAPEQATGGPRDAACDWYSVGATLYIALTGQVPFHGETLPRMMERKQRELPPAPRTLVAGVPEDLDALCLQLLHPDPKQRIPGPEVLARLHQPGLEVSPSRGAYLSPAATHVGARRFIGREPAVQALRAAYASVCTEGAPVVVLARGKAGIGKSALVRHVTDDLKSTAVVLRARCYERDSVPLKALDSLMDALARHLRQRPRHSPHGPPGLEDLAPTIASLASLFPVLQTNDDPPTEPARRGGEIDRAAFAALRELFTRLSAPRPAVLWIDDFQWGDPGSAYALQRIVRPPDPPPLLLIASYRSEDTATSPALHALGAMSETPGLDLRVLDLSPLDASEALSLAEAVLGHDTAPARLRRLATEAQGSPQFLHDLARFVAHGPSAAPEVTLDELLEIRIARLAAAPRRLLETVAVAGQPIPQTTALKAAAIDQEPRAAVQQLLALGLLRSLSAVDGDRLDAYHDRAREVVLAHLDGPGLRQLHHDLAAAVEQQSEAPDPELLARLHRGAGDLPRARHHAASAAQAAAEVHQWDRAATLYALAADLSASPAGASEFHLHRADALAHAGRAAAAAEAYLAARTGTDAPPPRWNPPAIRLTAHAAALLLSAGHREAGKAALTSGFAAAGLTQPAATVGARLAALWRRGQMAVRGTQWTERPASSVPEAELARVDLLWAATLGHLACEPAAAADVQAQHLLLALQTGEPRRVARALVVDAALASHLGPPGRTRMEVGLAEARRLAARLGDVSIAALADLTEAAAAGLTGDWPQALARAEARALGDDDHGLPWTRSIAQLQALRALFHLGRWSTLQARLPLLLSAAIDRDDRCARVWLHALAVWPALAAGDLEAARRELAAAQTSWPEPPTSGYTLQHLQIAEARAAVLLFAGEAAQAWQATLDETPPFTRSALAQTPAFLLSALDIRARSALAALRQNPRDPALRRAAVRAADDLLATGGRGHADLVRAGTADPDLQTAYSSPAGARHLHAAANAFEAAQLGVLLAVARHRLGDPAASAALAAQGVRDPARLAAVLAP